MFKLAQDANGVWTEQVLHSFSGIDGAYPDGKVTFDRKGNLLGTTPTGPGPNSAGTVFKMWPNSDGTWNFKTVYTFAGGIDGQTPRGPVVQGANGLYYGTTAGGGDAGNCQYGCGTVYELTHAKGFAWKERIIHNFTGSVTQPLGVDGSQPTGVVFDGYGKLFGAATNGGSATD